MNPCILALHGKRNEGELLQIAAPIDSNGGRRLSDVFVQLLTQNRPAFAPASIGGVVQEQDNGFSLPSASNQVVILQKANAVGSSLQSEPRSLLFAETTVLEQIPWIYCMFCPATSPKRQYMDNMDWHDQYSSISLLCDTSGSAATSHLSIYGRDSY